MGPWGTIMPNGGSDNCMTCSFNAKNEGELGYGHVEDPDPDRCLIRDLAITTMPAYTYCANHPIHNRDLVDFPVGPVLVAADGETRVESHPSPDTEAIRVGLLGLVARIQDRPPREYPFGLSFDEAVIWQLGEFREPRAAGELRRIAGFDPALRSPSPEPWRDRLSTVIAAREALEKIEQS